MRIINENIGKNILNRLDEDDYKSKTLNYNYATVKQGNKTVPMAADLSALRKYYDYLENIFSDTESYSSYELESDEFSNAFDTFIDALVDEQSRIEKAIGEIEQGLVNKKADTTKKKSTRNNIKKDRVEKPVKVEKQVNSDLPSDEDFENDDLPF